MRGLGGALTTGFTETLAGLSGWPEAEIPAIYQQIAGAGLATHGGGPARSFGELVFAAFAELIKDPKKYPQAGEAFHIAMDKLGRDTGQATLAAMQGLEAKFDVAIAGLDGLEVLRNGALQHLELLPAIATHVSETRSDVAEILKIISQQEKVDLDFLRAILVEMGEAAAAKDAGEIEKLLTAKATEFKALAERLNRLSNDDPRSGNCGSKPVMRSGMVVLARRTGILQWRKSAI